MSDRFDLEFLAEARHPAVSETSAHGLVVVKNVNHCLVQPSVSVAYNRRRELVRIVSIENARFLLVAEA